ncbi:MAG: hypothetical protein MGG11_05710 [Trichodesmium sp. MAG_R03]|nr:hypothetical protein [Trichodesmium sp. MAG_R03]
MQESQQQQLFTELNLEESTTINGGYNDNYQDYRSFLGFQLCPRSYDGYNRYSPDYKRYNSNYYKGNTRGYY